jgi:hypothetical protein
MCECLFSDATGTYDQIHVGEVWVRIFGGMIQAGVKILGGTPVPVPLYAP